MNLGTFLDKSVEKYSDKPFLQFYDQTITYQEFGRRVNKLANALLKLGFKKGDFIHVFVQNKPEVLISYFAIMKIGAVAGPVNGWWKSGEVEYLLNDSQGRGLIIEDQYLEVFLPIKNNCPHLEIIIEYGDNPQPGHISYKKLEAEGDETPVECTSQETETAFIFYTSGTTGNPKGVLLAHKSVLADVDGIVKSLKITEGMTILVFLPLFHVNAMITLMFGISMGHQIVLRMQFSASEFWQVVDKYKVHFWSAVPAVYQILLTDPGRQKYDLSSLKFGICGAAPLSKKTLDDFEAVFKIPIIEGYGLTEATCVSTLNPIDGTRKVGSIGLPLPGQDIKIVDEHGNICGVGEPGEILVGGDVVMKEYYNKPEETAETIENGFLHTGDVGYRDEDGYIFIVDRIKDMVIRGGENIYPKEIDNLLMTHPKIADAATIGVPDDVMGEEVKSFVIAADEGLTEKEVIDFCKEKLAAFKVPRYVEILEEDFPRNPLGKVLKKELKKWGLTPRPKKDKGGATVADIFGTMEKRVNLPGIKDVNANFGYNITGEGGGQYTVCVKNDTVKVLEGIHDPHVTSTISAKDWIAITLGKLDGMTAFTSGRLKVEGDMSLMMKAPKFFKPYKPPTSAPEATVADIFGTMESRVNPEGIKGVNANFGYKITGSGGGEYTVCVKNDTVKVLEGIHDPHVTSIISAKDWIAITLGKLDGMTAFTSGRLKVEGDMSLMMKAPKFFKKYVPPSGDQEDETEKEELIVLKQILSIPQKFTTGPLMGKFLKELRDNKRILANRCPKCGRHQVPPREVCAVCVVRVDDLVEVGPEGIITHYDIAYYASPDPLTGESRETPYCSAFFLLDGTKDNDIFWHEINPEHIDRIRKGARVRPVWNEKRIGSITDIKYFDVIS